MKLHKVVTGRHNKPGEVDTARALRRAPTPEEALLWMRLKGNRLRGLHFRRQQLIHGYVADFYCHAAGLVVEVDGEVHKRQREEDTVRDAVLHGIGLTVLRVTNEDVRADIDGVLTRILDVIGTPLPISGRGRGQGSPSL